MSTHTRTPAVQPFGVAHMVDAPVDLGVERTAGTCTTGWGGNDPDTPAPQPAQAVMTDPTRLD